MTAWWSHRGVTAREKLPARGAQRRHWVLWRWMLRWVLGLSIEGERAGEEKPHLILCPWASLQTSPVRPSVVNSKTCVFCHWGRGALLGAVQVHRVCLPNALYQAFYLLCLEERSSQQPASSCTALPMDRPALEVQAPPFRRMQEGVKRKKANEILWLKYTSLASPMAVRLMQGWLWLKMVLVRAGAGYGRGSGRPRGCVGAPLAKPPWDGGAPTLWGTCEPEATPNTRIQGCCGS